MPRPASLLAVCAGESASLGADRRATTSAIDKRPVAGPVRVDALGLVPDTQVDGAHHGGPDQALYVYAQEDADHWVAALQRDLAPGAFGENLRTCGVEVTGARIGARWRIGTVEVQVTAPRIPCSTFATFWDVPDLVTRFLSAGRPGAYLRVLVGGTIEAGDDIEVLDVPDHDVTIADALRIHTRDRHEAGRLLAADGLAIRARTWAEDQVAGRR
jgi:MOSC domain-containing protein YiiM